MLNELIQIKNDIIDFDCDSDNLKQVLTEFLSRKSKYIRSHVAILLLKLINLEITSNHYKLLKITETIHNASLIHDDVIDNSSVRRGKFSLNNQYTSHFAVIAGDFLILSAVKDLLSLNNHIITEMYLKTISDMCIAESEQYFMKGKIPTIQDYLDKTKAKTANLFSTLLKALLALSNIKDKRLVDFAESFGMAFQIKNDLDNFLTDKSDLKIGIYTAPYIYSMSDENISIEKTLDLIHNYLIKGKNNLGGFPNNIFKHELEELIESLCR